MGSTGSSGTAASPLTMQPPTTKANHLSCWRCTGPARRKRTSGASAMTARSRPRGARHPLITAFQVGWLSAWIARGLVWLTPYMVPVAGSTTALSISRTHDVTYTRATGRQRGDGSRPSGNSSNTSPRNM